MKPRASFFSIATVAALAALLPTSSLGCASREVVRGADDPTVDAPAMSTSLDKDDIQRTLMTLLNQLRDSPVMTEWRVKAGAGDRQTVAIAPFFNETTEHIDPQLDSMLSETETWLVNSGIAHVISHERQEDIIRQVEGAQRPVFDPRHIPQYGKQMGVKYFITGKVGASDERTADARRVQYFIFMQVIDSETSEIRWQQRAYVTKAIR
ncbi:MAG: penicillin-binding protein activator LpoB [Polyangiaceae bacterium]|jgi:TolB-like protein